MKNVNKTHRASAAPGRKASGAVGLAAVVVAGITVLAAQLTFKTGHACANV